MGSSHWQTARFRIALSRPQVMGIVNATPDSFSDGGQHASAAAAIAHCERLLREGADLLDIGGESTRPGSQAPGDDGELQRVLPVLKAAVTMGVPVSVDTSSPRVMAEALGLGVDIVNDVRALRRPGALACVAAHPQAGVCLMHMRGEPDTMQGLADYADVVDAVRDFLDQRLQAVVAAGVDPERIVLDPGIGFAKTDEHNLALLQRWSRKRTLGSVTGKPVGERQVASVVAALLAAQRGAAILRVHDVAGTVDALKVWRAVESGMIEGGA
jgi:dihydropteroate synthase